MLKCIASAIVISFISVSAFAATKMVKGYEVGYESPRIGSLVGRDYLDAFRDVTWVRAAKSAYADAVKDCTRMNGNAEIVTIDLNYAKAHGNCEYIDSARVYFDGWFVCKVDVQIACEVQ